MGAHLESTWEDDGQVFGRSPSGLLFVVVEGGSFEFGYTANDERELASRVVWTRGVAERVARLRTRVPRVAQVPAFLCSAHLITGRNGERLSTSYANAAAIAHEAGFRLLTDIEFEWLSRGRAQQLTWAVRESGRVLELDHSQWTTDSDLQPGRAVSGSVRGGAGEVAIQSAEDAVGLLACNRTQLDLAHFRFARSVPTN